MHIAQVDGESPNANYFGVGVGIGVGIEKVFFDPDTDAVPDPDPDPIHRTEVHNQIILLRWYFGTAERLRNREMGWIGSRIGHYAGCFACSG